jgi:hypothetical protein
MSYFAVIDTETTWDDQVMSIGIVVAETQTFRLIDKKYYVIDPAYKIGGMYENVLDLRGKHTILCTRESAIAGINTLLKVYGVTDIFAYNAKFDYGHLPELKGYAWYDIMAKAAYRQTNPAIPETAPCCSTGRLKKGYGVECMLRLLSGNHRYCEVHNAVEDAVDELGIMRLLGIAVCDYETINL